jgi:uncharacterized membrane protein YhfC
VGKLISGLAILCLSIGAFICVFLPAIIAAVVIAKRKASWKAFLVGAAVFTVSQGLLRMPLLNLLQNTAGYALFSAVSPVLFISVIALSAGVFEETGRYLGARFFLTKELNWGNALVFGLGHGGAEALLLAGLGYTGGPGVLQSGYVRALYDIIAGRPDISVLSAPPFLLLAGGIERILAVCIHIGMTMFVFYAVKYRKIQYFIYAILFHGLVDCSTYLLKILGVSMSLWSMEGTIAVFAALSLLLAFLLKAPLDRGPNNTHNEEALQ